MAKSKENLWRRRFAQWTRSGLTRAEFCRRKGISVNTFAWWRRKLRANGRPKARTTRRKPSRGKSPGFVPVKLVASRRPAGDGLELVLSGGRVLRIRPGFDPALLRQVLAALEGPAC